MMWPIRALPRSGNWSTIWSRHDRFHGRRAGRAAGACAGAVGGVFWVPKSRAGDPDAAEGSTDGPVPLTVLINPLIEPVGRHNGRGVGGLSVRSGSDRAGGRYTHIRYRATNLKGEAFERVATGFHARVVQHECDHLDGILYPQRMDDLGQLSYIEEMQRYRPADAGWQASRRARIRIRLEHTTAKIFETGSSPLRWLKRFRWMERPNTAGRSRRYWAVRGCGDPGVSRRRPSSLSVTGPSSATGACWRRWNGAILRRCACATAWPQACGSALRSTPRIARPCAAPGGVGVSAQCRCCGPLYL